MTRRSIIIAAKRSAVVPRGGAFRRLQMHELAAPIIRAALAHAGIMPEQVGEVILGNALGAGGNPARVAALASDLPERVAGLTIDRQCSGGMDAILLGNAMICAGLHDVVIAGGVESYSRRPVRMRSDPDGGAPQAYEQPPFTPWPDRDPAMPDAAEMLAQRYNISRRMQEDWAIASHAKALAAASMDEVVPLRGVVVDSFTRQLTRCICDRAKPLAGSVTAATTAVAADGAAICVLVADDLAERMGKTGPRIAGGRTLGGDPELPGLAPVAAIGQVLAEAGLAPRDLACAEIMEAFAVQAMICQQQAGIDPDITNPGGGALARGHPIGASGAINIVRLVHELQKTGGSGIAAIAAAGGLGTALLLRT